MPHIVFTIDKTAIVKVQGEQRSHSLFMNKIHQILMEILARFFGFVIDMNNLDSNAFDLVGLKHLP